MVSPKLERMAMSTRTEAEGLAARRKSERGVKTLAEALEERCPVCQGGRTTGGRDGNVPDIRPCPACHGTGKREEVE